MKGTSKNRLIIFIIAAILIAILGFVIGFVSKPESKTECTTVPDKDKITSETTYKEIVDMLAANNIEENLKYFTEKPHLASSQRNNELMDEIYKRFQSYGFHTKYHPYDVLLSLPNPKKRNHVYVLDKDGSTIFKTKGIEDFLEPSEESAKAYPSYLGYSPEGTVEGELVYVNYGRVEDFEELANKYKVNVSGKIVIARYGKIFRGNKVSNAEDRGAIGAILYSDPAETAPEGEKFIKGRWLPDDGMQRGSILRSSNKDIGQGDPLTPGYPSKDWAFHKDLMKLKGLPSIPAQPVSADDAFNIMKHMGGRKVDAAWTGKLNITYFIGPYNDTNKKVKIEVFNERKIKTITNVCGTIPGKIEPDRYVILGNHVDAWVFGGVDPSSGTSIMMEIARVIGEKVKAGWKPRRTIKFCGWDGEEYGLIGSSEFVEEYRSQLRDRAVAYINVDSGVSGNESLVVGASPMLHDMMFEAHKEVLDPFNSEITVFDRMKSLLPDRNYPDVHQIRGLGSGSDYTSFYQFIGIPSVDMGYRNIASNKRLNISGYPVYHSLHDTFYWIKNFVDRDFTAHLTVSRVAMHYLLNLANSPVIPFDVTRYDEKLNRDAKGLQKKLLENEDAKQNNIDPVPIISAASNFTLALKDFSEQMKKVDIRNPLELRMLNDRLIQLEKGFIYVDGLPDRHDLKHYIMAPSKYNLYGSSTFPAIADALHEAVRGGDWNDVKKQITITGFIIQNAADNLRSTF